MFTGEYKYNNFLSWNNKDGQCIVSLLKSQIWQQPEELGWDTADGKINLDLLIKGHSYS